jgi:thiopurine S-methyltransferase
VEAEFWLERWNKHQIGFHLDQVNPLLLQFELDCFKPGPIFVPLCGKSRDLLYFKQQGYQVLGVELAAKALSDFFTESGVNFEEREVNHFRCFVSDNLTLYNGDFFKLEAHHFDNVHQVYDRAALIALPPAMRINYVAHLLAILPRPLSIMLITMTYPQIQMKGPPFSVTDEEVRELYRSAKSIERLHYTSILEKESRFQQKGLTELYESVYHIQF